MQNRNEEEEIGSDAVKDQMDSVAIRNMELWVMVVTKYRRKRLLNNTKEILLFIF